jgi:hypothetical protein
MMQAVGLEPARDFSSSDFRTSYGFEQARWVPGIGI